MTMARNERIVQSVDIADIYVDGPRRAVNKDQVARLAESISSVGMQHPITIRYVEEYEHPTEGNIHGAYLLVAGNHRLEAHKALGRTSVQCVVEEWDADQARMWEIAENLHRSELTALERSEQIAEWVKLATRRDEERVSSHVETKPDGGRPESGLRLAARDLGIDKSDAHRSVKVAALPEAAKEAARAAGLDNNRSALLDAAKSPDPVVRITEIAAAKATKPIKVDTVSKHDRQANEAALLMSAWNAAGPDARRTFLSRKASQVQAVRVANEVGEFGRREAAQKAVDLIVHYMPLRLERLLQLLAETDSHSFFVALRDCKKPKRTTSSEVQP